MAQYQILNRVCMNVKQSKKKFRVIWIICICICAASYTYFYTRIQTQKQPFTPQKDIQIHQKAIGTHPTGQVTLNDVTDDLTTCPRWPSDLVGHQNVSVKQTSPSWRELKHRHHTVTSGGAWRPSNCTSRDRVAIIVPYRARSDHLRRFLDHIHPFLQRQLIQYGIYVIEQDDYSGFNRGMLLNIGYREAMADAPYDCAIFHDVDLLPENDHNLYNCPDKPRHMSVATNKWHYKLPYAQYFGGVTALTREQFELVNGFSNMYFGWGAEDDDFYGRVRKHKMEVIRYPADIARYTTIQHTQEKPSLERIKLLTCAKRRYDDDGLNSLTYEIKLLEKQPLYTWAYVWIDKQEVIIHTNLSTLLQPKECRYSVYVPHSTRQCTQQERLHHMMNICKAINNSTKVTEQRSLIDHKHHLRLCWMSKAGCTALKSFVAESGGFKPGNNETKELLVHHLGFLHKYNLYYMKEFNKSRQQDIRENYYSMLAIRHPLARILSYYRDKIVDATDKPSINKPRTAAILRSTRPLIFKNNQTLNKMMNPQTEIGPPTFMEFLSWVYKTKLVDEHWNRIMDACHVCSEVDNWDAILRVETMETDQKILMDRLNTTQRKIPLRHSHQGKQTGPEFQTQLSEYDGISSDIIDYLLDMHYTDMEMFGYRWDKKTNTAYCAIPTTNGTCC